MVCVCGVCVCVCVLHVNTWIQSSHAFCTFSPTPQLLGWLEEKLPSAGKLPPEMSAIIAPLYSCLEHRNGEVRKKSQAVVPLFMAKVGYEAMLKHAGKLKVRGREGWIGRRVGGILPLQINVLYVETELFKSSLILLCSLPPSRWSRPS